MPTANLTAHASIAVSASPESVWDALTNPEKVRQYMFGAEVHSDWKEGSAIRWEGTWKGISYIDKGTVLQAERPRLLRYSHFSPLTGKPDEPENYHNVTIELAADNGGTLLRLAQDHNATEEEKAHSEENWGHMLTALKKLVESSEPQR
ncbi:SRPBCC family protein [Flaviaesturariibacter terrae]